MYKVSAIVAASALVCALLSPAWSQDTNRFDKGGNYSIGPARTNFMQWATTNAPNQGDDNLIWSKNGRYMATDRCDPSVMGPNKFINIIGFTPSGAITNLGPRTSALNNPGPVFANVTDFTVNDDRVLFGFRPNQPPPNNKVRIMSCSVTGPVHVAEFLGTNMASIYSPSVIYDPVAKKERLLFMADGFDDIQNIYTVTYESGGVPDWMDRVPLTAFTNRQCLESVKWCPELGTDHQPLLNRYVITKQTSTNPPPPPSQRSLIVFIGVRDILNATALPPRDLDDPRFDMRITNASGCTQGTWTFDGNFLMCGVNTNDPSLTNEIPGLYSLASMGTNRTPIPFPTPPDIESLDKRWLCLSPNGMRAAFTVNSKVVVLPLQCENPAVTNAGATNIVTDGGYTSVTIPGQAIDSNYTFTIIEPTAVDTNLFPTNYLGSARDFGAGGIETQFNFRTNVAMSLFFNDSDIPEGISASNMAIFVYNPQADAQGQTGTWTQVQSSVDTNTHYVTSSNIMHFSIYALGTRVNESNSLPAPTGVAASDGAYTNKIRVVWNAVSNAAGYGVWRNTTNDSGSASVMGACDSTSYDDTTATAGRFYYYWVKSTNALTTSAFSSVATGWLSVVRSVTADFDGDGRADPAVYLNGNWYIWMSGLGYLQAGPFPFGYATGIPLPADYDGDRVADPAVVRGADWTVWMSGQGYAEAGPFTFGQADWTPLAADFDGDRTADPARYGDTNGQWYVWMSSQGYGLLGPLSFGAAGYLPVAADFDGDRAADPAVYDPIGYWHIWMSGAGYAYAGPFLFGASGWLPVAADYDHDGKADPAVTANDNWYIWMSGQGYALTGPYQFVP